jgi:DNA-binding NtrC family response regulator
VSDKIMKPTQTRRNPAATILVVDDEEVVRRSLQRVLANEHCRVEVASDGEQALQALEVQPYDLVLLDLCMPGMNGLAVLKTMKQRWPEGEVIVVTGYPAIDTATEAIRLGACDYRAKPLAPRDVIKAAACAMAKKHWTLRRVCTRVAETNRLTGGAIRPLETQVDNAEMS